MLITGVLQVNREECSTKTIQHDKGLMGQRHSLGRTLKWQRTSQNHSIYMTLRKFLHLSDFTEKNGLKKFDGITARTPLTFTMLRMKAAKK